MIMTTETLDGGFGRRFSIGTRLTLAFGALIVLLVAMAGVGAWRLAQLHERTEDLTTVNLRMERLVGEWLQQTRTNLVRRMVVTHSEDAELARLLTPEMNGTAARINELQAEIQKLVDDPQAAGLLQSVEGKRKAYLDIRNVVDQKKKSGDLPGAIALLNAQMVPAQNQYVDAIQALRDFYLADSERDAVAATESARKGNQVLLLCCVLGVLLAALSAWKITTSITRPVREAVSVARRVADGDLTVELSPRGRDEMAELLRAQAAMAQSLRELVSEVAQGARTVADTSTQIAQGNGDLSQRTEEQATTLEETASAMEELTTTVGQNAEGARAARELASGAAAVAREGGEAVGEVVATMTGISASSKKIAEIIGVIDGIAFQTNILALNAAVEAARAGEQGRGFAVVASEVRNLAQRSAQAAKEIKSLIVESVAQVDAGSAQVDLARGKMQDIVRSVAKVSELITEIASASQEQSSGIGQINTAVTQMDQVVQQNASLVEEAAAATEAMKGEAETLLRLMSRFRVGGEQAAPAAPQPVAPIVYRPSVAAGDTARAPRLSSPPPAHAPQGEWRQF